MPTVICSVCGKEFHRKPSRASGTSCCSIPCAAKRKSGLMAGENNHQFGKRGIERGNAFKGGRRISSWGYVLVLVGYNEYEFEHRLVMEAHLGRKLDSREHVHHKNEIRTDNRIENLELLPINEHVSHHVLLNPVGRDAKTGQFIYSGGKPVNERAKLIRQKGKEQWHP